jgi:hypothetical protein
MERRQRARLASVVVLAVVFASGAVVGMAVQRSAGSEEAMAEGPPQTEVAPRREGPASQENQGRPPQRPRLYQQVLAPEQVVVADSLVRVIEARRDGLERDFRRDMDSIFNASGRPQQYRQERGSLTTELRAMIRALMSPEQLTVYDSLLAADDARRRADRDERERLQAVGRDGRSENPPN